MKGDPAAGQDELLHDEVVVAHNPRLERETHASLSRPRQHVSTVMIGRQGQEVVTGQCGWRAGRAAARQVVWRGAEYERPICKVAADETRARHRGADGNGQVDAVPDHVHAVIGHDQPQAQARVLDEHRAQCLDQVRFGKAGRTAQAELANRRLLQRGDLLAGMARGRHHREAPLVEDATGLGQRKTARGAPEEHGANLRLQPPNAAVEIWHCDIAGNYSQYGSVSRQTFLRGIQTTGATGEVSFTTIYPGWYQGRATHIHAEVSVNGRSVKVTQIAFPESVNSAVHTSGAYASRGANPTSNAADGIFADSLAAELVTPLGSVDSGYTASFQIGVPL